MTCRIFKNALNDPSLEVVCHDARTTLRVWHQLGFRIANMASDSLLMSYLLDASKDYREPASMAEEVRLPLPTLNDFLGKGKKRIEFDSVEVPKTAEYVAQVARVSFESIERKKAQLVSRGMDELYRDLEMPLCRLLAQIEARGVCLDTSFLASLGDDVSNQIRAIEEKVYELAGDTINIGSPKQLSVLLLTNLDSARSEWKKRRPDIQPIMKCLKACWIRMKLCDPFLSIES